MHNSKEIRELEKLSAGLAPKKSGCKVCEVVLVSAIIIFISTVALVLVERRNLTNSEAVAPQRITDPSVKSERIQALREYIRSREGTTTSVIVKTPAK